MFKPVNSTFNLRLCLFCIIDDTCKIVRLATDFSLLHKKLLYNFINLIGIKLSCFWKLYISHLNGLTIMRN